MSMYYSPEIVKVLNDERIREIQRARLAGTRSVHATRRPQLADPDPLAGVGPCGAGTRHS